MMRIFLSTWRKPHRAASSRSLYSKMEAQSPCHARTPLRVGSTTRIVASRTTSLLELLSHHNAGRNMRAHPGCWKTIRQYPSSCSSIEQTENEPSSLAVHHSNTAEPTLPRISTKRRGAYLLVRSVKLSMQPTCFVRASEQQSIPVSRRSFKQAISRVIPRNGKIGLMHSAYFRTVPPCHAKKHSCRDSYPFHRQI
jgi:hypothetical protein